MHSLASVILMVVGYVWAIWAVTLSGFTTFAHLGAGEGGWDAHLSYALSLLSLVPILGGLFASFFADTVHGWGYLHAAFNLVGYVIPLALAAYLSDLANAKAIARLSKS